MGTNMQEYMANRRSERREKLLIMAGYKCYVCGSADSLEFNHIDRTTKSFSLSGAGLDTAWSRILNELAKCELLCKAHHLERTREQYKNKEIRPWNAELHGEYVHGTIRTYQEVKCKCPRCKKAKAVYRQGGKTYNEVLA